MVIADKAAEAILLAILAVSAYIDWKKGTVNLWMLFAAALGGSILNLLTDRLGLLQMAFGLFVGAVVLLIGYASRQAIGYGDGFMTAAAGIYLGGTGTIGMFFLSLLLAAISSLLLMLVKKKKRNDRIPFIPFMLGGYIFMMICEL